MYISSKDWKNYIDKLSALDKKAGQMMKEWIWQNGFSDTDALIDYAYAVATKYGEGSAALSAAMYDAVAEVEGKFYDPAEVAPTPTRNEVAKTVNGVKKWSQNPDSMANAVSRLVKRTGADTTLRNAQRDGAEFAWVPNGDTCAFCITLASRGWQKISAKTFRNGHAEHIHANCDCTYAVRFDGQSGVKGYDPQKYEDMYYGADGDTPQERINAIRRMKYQENKDRINAQKRAAEAKRGKGYNNIKLRLSAISSNDNDEKTIREEIGKIAPEKAKEAIKYFGEKIRNEPVEHAVVIERNGKVIHFIGNEKTVVISNVNTDGAYIIHNHPISNGIVSFGEDDFDFLKHNQSVTFYCINPEYEYCIKVLKPIDKVVYNTIYLQALKTFVVGEEIQDKTMNVLKEMGYVTYDKKRITG